MNDDLFNRLSKLELQERALLTKVREAISRLRKCDEGDEHILWGELLKVVDEINDLIGDGL